MSLRFNLSNFLSEFILLHISVTVVGLWTSTYDSWVYWVWSSNSLSLLVILRLTSIKLFLLMSKYLNVILSLLEISVGCIEYAD